MAISEAEPGRSFPRIPWTLGVCVFLAIGAFFLWEEHRAHLLGALPYLLLLACPLMHLFMHRGHGNGGSDSASQNGAPNHGGHS
jgi:hypothetical protein